jgi:hypothetical protein
MCNVVEMDCNTHDGGFTVSSSKVSVNTAGVWTSTCLGITTNKPTKATKCDGETSNGSAGDTASPQFACLLLMQNDGSSTTGPVFTDDWIETITPSGNVKMTCKFDPKETGK